MALSLYFPDSTIQSQLQAQIDQSLSGFTELQENGKYALQGAGVIVDNKTNYVKPHRRPRHRRQFNRAYLSARQPGSTIKPLIDYGPAFDTGEYYPTRMVDDHKWTDGPSNSGGRYFGNVTVREALNRSLNTVAWQILEDIGIDYGLDYLGEMQFQKLTYVDNNVPSLSIGGFTNGVRVVDMAKGYSTLANGGVYNDRTCIIKIEHEHDGELTKDLKPSAHQVYRDDSAFMLTDVLKGTFTAAYGTGQGLGLDNDMPAAGKTGTTNSSKDTWFCGYTRYYTTAIWVGYDIPRNMPGIYGATYAGRIWKSVMDQIHEGLEPSGNSRAQSHKRQAWKIIQHSPIMEKGDRIFMEKEIGSVEDTYTVKDEYNSITSKLPLLDDGELRASLLEKVESRYDYFKEIIAGMSDEISRYEAVQAEEKKQAQEQAAKDAEAKRAQEEKAVKKQTFMQALERIENLEYQETDAEDLVSDAIDKLSLVAGDDEEASLSARLQAAISRITTLPTESEWNAAQAEKEAEEAQKESQAQVQVQSQQRQLRSALSKEQYKWNNAEIYGPGGRGDEN